MDYAENYVCTAQDEVQSAHWVNQAVTIHPIQAFVNSSDVPVYNQIKSKFISRRSRLKRNSR